MCNSHVDIIYKDTKPLLYIPLFDFIYKSVHLGFLLVEMRLGNHPWANQRTRLTRGQSLT